MTRAGAKPLLDVMKDLNTLRLVDIRGNTDGSLLGVLENGEHYTTFSTFQVSHNLLHALPPLLMWQIATAFSLMS